MAVQEEALIRLERHGRNELKGKPKKSLLALFLAYRLSKSFADRIIHVALQMETIRSGRPRPLLLKNAGNDVEITC